MHRHDDHFLRRTQDRDMEIKSHHHHHRNHRNHKYAGRRCGDETPSAGAGGGGRLWQRQNRTCELMIMMNNEKKVKVKVVSGKLL